MVGNKTTKGKKAIHEWMASMDIETPSMRSTRINCHINAPRTAVYRALLDPRVVPKWKVPDGMTCHVHAFDAREGGSIRISLTYDTSTSIGKTDPHTDTYHGRLVKLVPNKQVVEVDEFETSDPALARRNAEFNHTCRCRRWHGSDRRTRKFTARHSTRRQRNGVANGARKTEGVG